jgi:hypothetical protein
MLARGNGKARRSFGENEHREISMTRPQLSDKALGVFAFALYHQLTSGEPVSGVIAQDDAGHRADPEAVSELEQKGLATADDSMITFTEDGMAVLNELLGALKG